MLPDNTKAGSIVAQPARVIPPVMRRVLVYGCVGVAVSLFYSIAVIFFVWLLRPISPTFASIVAFVITVPAAYLAHARITFADRPNDTFQPLPFAVTTAAAFVVSTGGMYWITEIANRSYLLGIAWTWLMIPAMNLSIYMLWVFRVARDTGKP